MSKKVYLDQAAEKEATDIGKRFMNSTDVVGDMSRAYGADLSSVKIHTDDNAASQAAERGVDAFSTGKDVFFARNAFDQNDSASRGLLAHELSHSLQQGVGGESAGMTRSAPMGAAQGGLLSWFRNRKKKAQHLGSKLDSSQAAKDHIARYRAMEAEIDKKNGVNRIAKAIRAPADIGNFHGGSFLDAANRAYRQTTDAQTGNELSEAERYSKALTFLGVRESGKTPAIVDKLMRGNIYDNVQKGYRDIMTAEGLDLGAMASPERKTSSAETNIGGIMDKATFVTGEGIEDVMGQAFDLFSQETLGDASLDYLQELAEGVSSAELFKGQMFGSTGASGFALQTLINTVGANMAHIASDTNLSVQNRKAAMNVGTGIGSLPKLALMDENEVPESLRSLRSKYIQLQADLDAKMKERMKR